jgi:hypothetical protein
MMLVACLPDNYDQVVAITKKMVVPTKEASSTKKKLETLG